MKSFRDHFAGYRDAVFARDVAAFTALYDESVRVFDLWDRWSYDALATWRGMANEWFGSLGDERVVVEFSDIQVSESGDLAYASAFTRFTGQSAEGESLRSMENRLTWVGVRTNGVWRIVHEHTSAPVDPDSMRAKLSRT